MTLLRPPQIYLDDTLEEITANRIVVVNQIPTNYEEHVPITELIRFDVIDLGAGIDIPNTVQVWMNGDLVYDGAAFQPGYLLSVVVKGPTPGSGVNDRWIFVINHDTDFTSEQIITMRVEADSTGGYTTVAEWAFYAVDIEKPEVLSVEGTSPRTVKVTFNEPVLEATINSTNVVLSSTDKPVYVPAAFEVIQLDGATYELKFEQELSNAKDYNLYFENITDDAEPVPNVIDPVTMPFTSAAYPWPEDRVWDLWSWVPGRVRWADRLTGSSPGHTEYYIMCLQEVADLLLFDVDEDRYIYDADRAPIGSIDLLLNWFYNPFRFVMTDEEKRKLVRVLQDVHQSKNAPGLEDVIFFFLGIPVEVVPMTGAARSWRLAGSASDSSPPYGKLGISTYLRPPDGDSHYYTFKVIVPVALTDDQRTKMIQIIETMKAAHEHYILEEPTPPPSAKWLLGIAGRGELGKTTFLG